MRDEEAVKLQEEGAKVSLRLASGLKKTVTRLKGSALFDRYAHAPFASLLNEIVMQDINLPPGVNPEEMEVSDFYHLRRKKTAKSLILTDEAIHIFFETGRLFGKADKFVLFPLKYASSVEKSGTIFKNVRITFDLPKDEKGEKTEEFYLQLEPEDREKWASQLKDVI